MDSSIEKHRPVTVRAARVVALAVATFTLALPFVACAETRGGTSPGSGADDAIAHVDGEPITRAEVEAMVASDLMQLDIRRQDLLSRALDTKIAERLVALEAARQNLTTEAILASAEGDLSVSEAEIDAFYAQNAARIRQPKEQIASQIRDYLVQEKRQAGRAELVARLRQTYDITVDFEPLRVAIESAGAASKGPESAPVTLIEFSDFQCPACRRAAPAIDAVYAKYGDDLRVVFRHFPLRSIHPQAQLAAEAASCARRQQEEAFWTMHDALFAQQNALGRDDLVARAETLALDASAFVSCLDGREARDEVNRDFEVGERAGVGSTPSIFVNGRPVMLLSNEDPVETLSRVIDDELRRKGVTRAEANQGQASGR